MLPKTFSPTGDYTERVLDRARGYRLLVHAEIESYLEDRSKDIVIFAIREWKRSQKPTYTLLSFLANYHSSWKDGDDENNEQVIKYAKHRGKAKDSINEIIDHAQSQFIQRIKDNHGVRENNLRALLNPVGIDIDELDSTWVTNMDSFGQARGEIAHNAHRSTTPIDPQDELNKVKLLIAGLKLLDEKITLLSSN